MIKHDPITGIRRSVELLNQKSYSDRDLEDEIMAEIIEEQEESDVWDKEIEKIYNEGVDEDAEAD